MTKIPDRSAVVIVVEGLPAGFLGTYGNAWLPTPTLDRLASQSIVVEFPWIDAIGGQAFSDGVFFGRHACCPLQRDAPGIGSLLRARNIDTLLLTDDESLLAHPGVSEFTSGELIAEEKATSAAVDIESTMTAQFLAVCAERMTRIDKPSLVWFQFRGLLDCWDAPPDLRSMLADESDPRPPEGVFPIHRVLQPNDDPDIALGAMQAFAAQVAVIDECLAPLIATIDDRMDPQRTLLIVTSSQGYALGEHAVIGGTADRLYSELLHVPLIIRTPDSLRQPSRRPDLAQPPGVFGTLADWFEFSCDRSGTGAVSIIDAERPASSRAVTIASNSAALRVPAWFCISDPPCADSSAMEQHRLYAKPDDRWDANDVANLCPGIVDQLRKELRSFQQAAALGRLDQLPELPVELTQAHQ